MAALLESSTATGELRVNSHRIPNGDASNLTADFAIFSTLLAIVAFFVQLALPVVTKRVQLDVVRHATRSSVSTGV